ncbi:hypothetical protein [Porphyromonas pogonae]|nr:hypothetical protein [Porphyromonas pogonae]
MTKRESRKQRSNWPAMQRSQVCAPTDTITCRFTRGVVILYY